MQKDTALKIAPICEVLRLLRIANDMSIKELSQKTKISVAYITELERGVKSNPSYDVIKKYSEALGIDMDVIMYFVKEYSKENYNYQKKLLKILSKIVK